MIRRMRGLLLAAALFVLLGMPGSARAESAEQGDVNGDWLVTAADAAVLLRGNAGLLPDDGRIESFGDLTQNGVVDGTDAEVLLYLASGKIPELVPFLERLSTGLCDERLFDRFSYTGVVSTDSEYRSENVAVSIESRRENGVAYYVADIFIQDITSFRTAFSNGKYKGRAQYTPTIARANSAIIAVSGDYYATNGRGPIIRNGEAYRTNVTSEWDVGVLRWDGVFETYRYRLLNWAALSALPVYQTWVFGPRLLDDEGNVMTSFKSGVARRNPRSAIGYYEPGHYCFVLVDGRQEGYSKGMSLKELAGLFHSLGCVRAYNLDGGETAVMATSRRTVNRPYRDGRTVSDIVYIGEPLYEGNA